MTFGEWILKLITNPFILTGAAAWLVAQVVKTIIHAVINKKLVLERLTGDGGMPSAHSATVSSLCVFSLLHFGPDTFQFAVTLFLAIIVCHDAMGVRQEAGKQAVVINDMVEQFEKFFKQDIVDIDLKELVGHTPLQVLAGITLGVANAFLMHYAVFGG